MKIVTNNCSPVGTKIKESNSQLNSQVLVNILTKQLEWWPVYLLLYQSNLKFQCEVKRSKMQLDLYTNN